MTRKRERALALLQRIKTPFSDPPAEEMPRISPRLRSVGEVLRERREELALDLDGIGEALRIKPAYLAALEQGRSHDLPGPTYAIGFVRAYAHYLGLDAEAILVRFKDEATGLTARPDLSLPVPLGERSLPGAAMLLVALILAMCGYGTWYYLSTGERSRPERVAPVPASLRSPSIVAGSPVPSTETTVAAETPAAPPATTGAPAATTAAPAAAPAAPAAAPAPPSRRRIRGPARRRQRPARPRRRPPGPPPRRRRRPRDRGSSSRRSPIAGSRCAPPTRRWCSRACSNRARPTRCRRGPACSCAPAMPGRWRSPSTASRCRRSAASARCGATYCSSRKRSPPAPRSAAERASFFCHQAVL